MIVTVDNVWATPSTLHMRVTVWGNGNAWRHRYDAHVPVDEIPTEAISALWAGLERETASRDEDQGALF